ncbi:MAG TPA: GNAT family N-acetyltransferase [Armatimonadota bacterium]|nr:GNAT family N-acetyltransferase [Armatimonadota bacterium]
MITVRRAAPDDAKRVHNLMEKADQPGTLPFDSFREIYLDTLADKNQACVVVTVDTAVTAFGTVRFNMLLHRCKPVATVQEFVVDERRRGKGVAARLISAMMLLARDRGCVSLEVDSPRASKQSHRFFEKQGFAFTHYKLAMTIGLAADEDGALQQASQD